MGHQWAGGGIKPILDETFGFAVSGPSLECAWKCIPLIN